MSSDNSRSQDEAIEILKAIRDRSREAPDMYEPDPNLSRIYDYKDYLRNSLVD